MLVTIEKLISPQEVMEVRRILDEATFVSGRVSAGKRAAARKKNSEIPVGANSLDSLNRIVMGALVRNETYRLATLPLKVAAPFYARYVSGMYYDSHIDDPVMGDGPRYRSDVSITIFLNAPEEYQGGELCIDTSFGEQRIKQSAGSAVLYPSSTLHRVDEVTGGERLVAVTWLQSMVRSEAQRELLYKLAMARDQLFCELPDSSACATVEQTYVNLVRMWSEV
ncbi:MAG: PKHD-type hydroxylase [marine bacterium B5-7]|nr:MAG: PKHD-type hydroxylase [marine bacterium B5-7]